VVGQVDAKLGLRGSRSGRHHMLSTGLGSAKTTLAEGVPGLLPDLDVRDALEGS
jgi:magnesium chelatase family protein